MTATNYVDTSTNSEYRSSNRIDSNDSIKDLHCENTQSINKLDDTTLFSTISLATLDSSCLELTTSNRLESETSKRLSQENNTLPDNCNMKIDAHQEQAVLSKTVSNNQSIDSTFKINDNSSMSKLVKKEEESETTKSKLLSSSISSSSIELVEVVSATDKDDLSKTMAKESQLESIYFNDNTILDSYYRPLVSPLNGSLDRINIVDTSISTSPLKLSDQSIVERFESNEHPSSSPLTSTHGNVYLDIGICQQQLKQQHNLVTSPSLACESHKVNLLANHLADSATSFIISEQYNNNVTHSVTDDSNLNNLNYHQTNDNNQHLHGRSTTNPILISGSSFLGNSDENLFLSHHHHHHHNHYTHHHNHLNTIDADNDCHYCRHGQQTLSPLTGTSCSFPDCNSLLHNQQTISNCNNRSSSPSSYLNNQHQANHLPVRSSYFDQNRYLHQDQQSDNYDQLQSQYNNTKYPTIYNDLDNNFVDPQINDANQIDVHCQKRQNLHHLHRDATSFILINSDDNDFADNNDEASNNNKNTNSTDNILEDNNNNSYIIQQAHQLIGHDHYRDINNDDDRHQSSSVHHNLHNLDQRSSIYTQQQNQNNDNNQYSLMNSLNSSSSSTIINGVHGVSITESSIISSSSLNDRDQFYNHHHHSHDININSDCHNNEDEFYPMVCRWTDCFLSFTDMPELVKHIEEAHVNSIPEEKHRYFCQWTNCRRTNQPFNARYKLLIHMRVHSGEKPYPCDHESCKKRFSRLENLKIHIRSHTGQKPYECRYEGCKKAFTNSSDRIKHHKTHLDAKPYSCSYNDCDKRYTDPSSLRKHLKLHKKLDSDSGKIDRRLNYINVIKNNNLLDTKLSQSWSAGYTRPSQINGDVDWSTFTNDYTQSRLANSFSAGCSSSYISSRDLDDANFLGSETNLPSFACLASKSLNPL